MVENKKPPKNKSDKKDDPRLNKIFSKKRPRIKAPNPPFQRTEGTLSKKQEVVRAMLYLEDTDKKQKRKRTKDAIAKAPNTIKKPFSLKF